MTKEQAHQAMEEGKKVTHISFMPNEWYLQNKKFIVDECGGGLDDFLFWSTKRSQMFDEGWSIYEEPKQETQEELWEELLYDFFSNSEGQIARHSYLKKALSEQFTIIRK